MNDKQLRLFLQIADQGSFSRAEETAYISKQAMLRQINSLEQEIGVRLFSRTPGGVSLTDAGKEFYKGAGELLQLQADILARCRNATRLPECIRIGQVEHQALLHDVTDAFALKFPDIRIQKVIHPNHSGEYRVEHDIIDVGETFYTAHTAAAAHAYTRLTDLPYMAAMSHRHPLARCPRLSLPQLTAYPLIVFEPMIKKEYLAQLTAAFAGCEERLSLRSDVDNQVAVAFECSASRSILLTANCFVRSMPELTVLPLDNGWFQEYGIIYRPNPAPAVQKYIDLAVSLFSGKKPSL